MIYSGISSLGIIGNALSSCALNLDLGATNVKQAKAGDTGEILLQEGADLSACEINKLNRLVLSSNKVVGKKVNSFRMEVPVNSNVNTITVPVSLRFPALEVFGDTGTNYKISDLFKRIAIFKYINCVPYLMSTDENTDWFTMKVEKIDGIVIYTLSFSVVIYDGGPAIKPLAKSSSEYHYFVVKDGKNDGKCVDSWKSVLLTNTQIGSSSSGGGGGGCSVGFAPTILFLGLPLFFLKK